MRATLWYRLVLLSGVLFALVSWAHDALAAPSVTIDSPSAGSTITTTTLAVSVTVNSPGILVATVHAQAGSVGANLTTSDGTHWSTTSMNIAALPAGPFTLDILATDATGATGSASEGLVYAPPPPPPPPPPPNKPPVVTTPMIDGFVARPTVRIQATCVDPDGPGCTSLSAAVGGVGTVAQASGGTLDQTVSLPSGAGPTLTFVGVDAAGAQTTITQTLYGDTSPTLTEIARGDGPIADFDATRVLFAGTSGLVIRSRTGAGDTPIGAGTSSSRGHLTSVGAIWDGGQWRNGILGANPISPPCVYVGDYGVSWPLPALGGATVTRYDVVADATFVFSASSNPIVNGVNASVAANGDVVAGGNHMGDMVWLHGTTLTTITPSGGIDKMGVLTDGIHVVFLPQQSNMSFGVIDYYDLAAGTGGDLTQTVCPTCVWNAGPDYRVANGWIAYRDTFAGQRVVFTRAPDGTTALASAFPAPTTIDGLADDGAVMYIVNGSTRYLGRAGTPPATITTHTNGQSVYYGGKWYVTMGASLFLVDASAGLPDGGAPDAGGDDAGGGGDAGASDAGDAGASDAGGENDAGGDAEPPDAGVSDAGSGTDGAPPVDGGVPNGADGGGATDADVPGPSGGGEAAPEGGEGAAPEVNADGSSGGCALARGDASSPVPLLLALALMLRRARRRVTG